jgi:hypothetical protein
MADTGITVGHVKCLKSLELFLTHSPSPLPLTHPVQSLTIQFSSIYDMNGFK